LNLDKKTGDVKPEQHAAGIALGVGRSHAVKQGINRPVCQAT
jgi:hypothetical protein